MTIDPLASLLIGAFGAAALTVAGGIFGAWIQSRREHARWVREQRMDAYRQFIRAAERMPVLDTAEAGHEQFMKEMKDAFASLALLGPDALKRAALEHMIAAARLASANDEWVRKGGEKSSAAQASAEVALFASRDAFAIAARKELGIDA